MIVIVKKIRNKSKQIIGNTDVSENRYIYLNSPEFSRCGRGLRRELLLNNRAIAEKVSLARANYSSSPENSAPREGVADQMYSVKFRAASFSWCAAEGWELIRGTMVIGGYGPGSRVWRSLAREFWGKIPLISYRNGKVGTIGWRKMRGNYFVVGYGRFGNRSAIGGEDMWFEVVFPYEEVEGRHISISWISLFNLNNYLFEYSNSSWK